jgi:hypothetical protein
MTIIKPDLERLVLKPCILTDSRNKMLFSITTEYPLALRGGDGILGTVMPGTELSSPTANRLPYVFVTEPKESLAFMEYLSLLPQDIRDMVYPEKFRDIGRIDMAWPSERGLFTLKSADYQDLFMMLKAAENYGLIYPK